MQRLLSLLSLLVVGCSPDPAQTDLTTVASLLGGNAPEGFMRAYKPRSFRYPQDHGVHPGFQSEWWYITGNLDSKQGRRFGFQITFFRFALFPPLADQRTSNWATDHVWMAHVAVTDPHEGRHYAEERLAREALGLAGAGWSPFKVWLEDWHLIGTDNGFPWRLMAEGGEFGLELGFNPVKAPVQQGREGLNQKGEAPGNASYYYSITRMETSGSLTLGEQVFEVKGFSWLDREWGTSALGRDQAGWDWFSLHLNDGTDLMYYRLRKKTGESDPHSAGSLLFKNGEQRMISAADVRLEPERWWTSPEGARYPVSWELTVRPLGRTFLVSAVIDDQEMDLSVVYWEGAVNVFSEGNFMGRGYLEMTGY